MINVIVNITHTTQAIRYVRAFCFFVFIVQTTKMRAMPNNAAAILGATLFMLVFMSVL